MMGWWAEWQARLRKVWAIYGVRPFQIRQVARSIEHISGPLDVTIGPDELAVFCLLRDGELYVHSFMRHYLALGAKHIFLLDNGSTDRTLELARQYSQVTILRSRLPFRTHKMALRHYLIRRFAAPNRWALYVDVDELFDYPYSDVVPLPDFLGYLRRYGYTAVVAYMLDMFSDGPLAQLDSDIEDDLPGKYRFYDLSDVVKMDYYFPRNELPTPEIKAYFGGIRRTLFAPEELRFVLTKHPLFLQDGRLQPLFVDEHFARGAQVADVTAVLYHYKFLADFAERTRRAIREENYHTRSEDYKKYWAKLQQAPDLSLVRPSARELGHVNELAAQNFLYVSPRYSRWAIRRP
ncbi:MAG: glycosyltransferase family 2 protein [Chloroflexi bacterium]|nr:glycosyltransferase family 2 protein [Chloroflexota bacterium]